MADDMDDIEDMLEAPYKNQVCNRKDNFCHSLTFRPPVSFVICFAFLWQQKSPQTIKHKSITLDKGIHVPYSYILPLTIINFKPVKLCVHIMHSMNKESIIS